MKVTVEGLSPVMMKVSVEVPAETVDQALERAYRAVGRQARIKGFRPGKIPRRILEQHYGHQVAHEVEEDLVRETWPPALEQEKIEAVSLPELEHGDHPKPGEQWAYTALVQVLPPVQVTDYQGLEVRVPKVEVSAEDVDVEVERLRQAMAQLVPVEDRTRVEQGDFVVANMDATVDGKPFEEGKGEGFTFEVTGGDITQGNLGAAEGREVGDTVEVRQQFSETARNERLKGKEVVFRATLEAIKRREVPPVDDELAKDVGEEGVDSLLALRGFIRERIQSSRKADAERQLKDELVKVLVERNPIEVPPVLVERTSESLLRPVLEQMVQAGIDPSKIGAEHGRAMLQEVRPRAELVVKGSLLLKALADQEKIEVGDEDIEAQFQEISKQANVPVEKVRATYGKNAEEKNSLRRRLLEDKALAWLAEKANIMEVEPEAGKPGSEESVDSSEEARAE